MGTVGPYASRFLGVAKVYFNLTGAAAELSNEVSIGKQQRDRASEVRQRVISLDGRQLFPVECLKSVLAPEVSHADSPKEPRRKDHQQQYHDAGGVDQQWCRPAPDRGAEGSAGAVRIVDRAAAGE